MWNRKPNTYCTPPICPKCKKEMELDDIDFDFPGKQNNYWLCNKCHSSAFDKIRYGKLWKREFTEPGPDEEWEN